VRVKFILQSIVETWQFLYAPKFGSSQFSQLTPKHEVRVYALRIENACKTIRQEYALTVKIHEDYYVTLILKLFGEAEGASSATLKAYDSSGYAH